MAFRVVVIKDGDVTRYPVGGPASEVHVARGEGGEVTVRIYDREARYGGQGAIRDLSSFVLATPGAAVRIVFEEFS